MSNGFFKELEDMLDNEFISLKDSCALFAGFCPLEPYQSDYGSPDKNRRYKRISDGKEVKPSEADFKEMRRFADKWEKSNFDITSHSRYPNIIDRNDTEISVRFAFKVGLGFRPLDERICNLYDAAVEAGLIPPEPSVPIEQFLDQNTRPPKLSQSALQDNLIHMTKYEQGLTAGKLFERWEKDKPYFVDEIISSDGGYLYYRLRFTTHSQNIRFHDYDALQAAINRAYKKNKERSK